MVLQLLEIFCNHLSATILEIFWRQSNSSQRCQKSPILMIENPNYFVRGIFVSILEKSVEISSTMKQMDSLRVICLNSLVTMPFHHFVRMFLNLFDAKAFPSLHCQEHFLLFNDNVFGFQRCHHICIISGVNALRSLHCQKY